MKQGKLSIHSENIFPIIKKWLYSDHDIFARELISNSSDAITKLMKLSGIGEFKQPVDEEYRIYVIKDAENNTLTFIDNGIGMTEEEVNKYINDIAFSGAEDFLAMYKDKSDAEQIIGHFGLGFYSAFMVSTTVEIDTLSYKKDAEAVRWINHGGIEYEMTESDRILRGTAITLHLSEDSKTFLTHDLDRAIMKYCSFMPYPIFVLTAEEFRKLEYPFRAFPETQTENKEQVNGTEAQNAAAPQPVNDIHPLYLKQPTSVTDDEYNEFYKKTFFDFKDPIFWIHLNMDYPFRLKGIIYFPRAKNEYEFTDGHMKLYNSQVFVADNVNEVVPEFLRVLNGVIDCPDLPLNVSRSALQNDGFVKKISEYIGKKVADKLRIVSTKDRKAYEDSWKDIGPFIEFGVIRDEKFSEQMKDNLLFQYTDDTHATLSELKEAAEEKTVYYTTDPMRQAQYIEAQLGEGNKVIILKHAIEQALISHLEMSDPGLKFRRVDSIEGDGESVTEHLQELFGEDTVFIDMKDESIPAMYLQSEDARRGSEFAKLYGLDIGLNKDQRKLAINRNNKMIEKLLSSESNQAENHQLVADYIKSLAKISSDQFTKDDMREFTKLSNEVLGKVL